MGVLASKSGRIVMDGQDVTRMPPHARAHRGMAYVPQGREIFPRLSVEENLLMGLATKKHGSSAEIPSEIFEMFPVLKSMLNRRGGDLSGGQQQQLADHYLVMRRGEIVKSGAGATMDSDNVRSYLSV